MISIPHSKPTIDPKDINAVVRVINSGHLAQGQKVLEFENEMSRYVGVNGAVATNSGTSALHLALLALNIGPGDEVMIPSYVCSALLNAVLYTGANVRIVDVNEHDFNISPIGVKKNLTKSVKAIIVPHMFGCPANLKELLMLGVPIIEDCAQSIGACYKKQKVGSYGTLAISSFYATKVMTTGEGGMVFSNQKKLLEKIRHLREYDKFSDFKVRFNYKMTDFQAALGLTQLKNLPHFIEKRKKIAQIYNNACNKEDTNNDSIYYRYILKVDHNLNDFIAKLNRKGIGATIPVFKPLHRYFKKVSCPVSEKLMKQCVSIPIYPALNKLQIQKIANNIR